MGEKWEYNSIWELRDYEGKLNIVTKKGAEHAGFVCLVEDEDEMDEYECECVFIDCEDGTWMIFANEIERVEKL